LRAKKSGIKGRVLLLTLLPVSLMALVLGGYFTWMQQSELQTQLLQRGEMIAEQLAPLVAPALGGTTPPCWNASPPSPWSTGRAGRVVPDATARPSPMPARRHAQPGRRWAIAHTCCNAPTTTPRATCCRCSAAIATWPAS
jgi:hypothetical protein